MNEFAPARFWRRFMSMTYESIILFGVWFFFAYAYSSLTQFKGQPGAKALGYQIFICAVIGVYFVYFWSAGRRTLPMKTVEVMLHDTHQKPITPLRATVRYAVICLFMLGVLALAHYAGLGWLALGLIPAAWALVDKQSRTLYDIAAGTRLVIVPVPPRAPKITAP